MKTFIKSFFSVALSSFLAFSFTSCIKDVKDKSEVTTTVPTQQTTILNTIAETTKKVATTDQAQKINSYNYNRIKQDTEKISNNFDATIKKQKFKGTAYYKIGNDFEYIGSNGFANKDTRVYNSLNTSYYIGSLTKSFTSVAILLLQEQELLSTNDTIDKFFPDYQYANKITIRNLLTMTDGIPDYMGKNSEENHPKNKNVNVSSENSYEKNHEEIINWILSQELISEPGEKYSYSNSGYYLLGDIIQKVSGKSYEDFIKTNILDVVGMKNTGFEKTYSLAVGYQEIFEDDWLLYDGVLYSSAGLISDLGDILKWIDALSGEELLSVKSKEEMFTPYLSRFGYGIYVDIDGKYYINSSLYRYKSQICFTQNKSEIFVGFSNYTQTNITNLKNILDTNLNLYRI